jgi:hypothetical protein
VAALQAYLQANAVSGFALPAFASDIPTISWAGALSSAAPPATTLPAGAVYPAAHSRIGKAIPHRFSASLPGNPAIGSWPCLTANRPYTCKAMPRTVSTVQAFRFKTDAQVIELAGVVTDGSRSVQTLIVDGRLVPAKVLSSARARGGWNYGAIRLEFASRKIRDIWMETAIGLAYLKIDQSDSLFALDDDADPQITVIGDSFLQVRSGAFGNGGAIALSLAARLGIRKVATDAIGGTGYWNSGWDSLGNVGNLKDRLPGHATDGSAIYLVMAGLNDYGDPSSGGTVWPSRQTYEDTVLFYLQGLRAAQPHAVIVVTAPLCPVPPMSDSTHQSSSFTNTSGKGDFLYKAELFKQSLQQIAGPWVYIDVLMGGGWLNSSGATGDITNLQWFTGGTPAPGTSATYKPGNTDGGGGGGFGGIADVGVLSGGRYSQAPEITASGGSGSGLLLSATIDSSGSLTQIDIVSAGEGYTAGSGLPTISIDPTFEQIPAVLGAPTLIVGINPNGEYPLQSFAPIGATPDQLNNIYVMLARDTVHPSPVGAEYLAFRLARNIYDAVLAL